MTDRSPVAPSTHSPTSRIVLRNLGAVLLLAGLVLLIRGGISFAQDMSSDSLSADPGFGPILTLAAGAFRGEPAAGTEAADKAGQLCSSCGVLADRGDRFCDACGHGLVDR